MTRYVIKRETVETNGSRQALARAGVAWLAASGGGTVLVPGWNEFEDCFGLDRERYESLMLREHVAFERYPRPCRSRVGLPAKYGNVLLAYPSRDEVEAVESWRFSGDTAVIEWDSEVTDWWAGLHDVRVLNPA